MKSVLIVDDDRVLRKLIVRTMEATDAQLRVLEAEDGQAAIEIIEAEPVDLVVTDINMPRVNGLMLLAYMNVFFPAIPCFVMTAYGTTRMKSKIPDGFLKFYHKPLDAPAMAADAVTVLEAGPRPGERKIFSLGNFLDMINLEGFTCTVTVESEAKEPCHLFIDDGFLLDAVMGERRGEAVAVEAISQPNVNFSMEIGCPDTIQKQINRPLGELIEKLAVA